MNPYVNDIVLNRDNSQQIRGGFLSGFVKVQDGFISLYENKNIIGRIIHPSYTNGYYLYEFHEILDDGLLNHSEVSAAISLIDAEQNLASFSDRYVRKGQTSQELIEGYFLQDFQKQLLDRQREDYIRQLDEQMKANNELNKSLVTKVAKKRKTK